MTENDWGHAREFGWRIRQWSSLSNCSQQECPIWSSWTEPVGWAGFRFGVSWRSTALSEYACRCNACIQVLVLANRSSAGSQVRPQEDESAENEEWDKDEYWETAAGWEAYWEQALKECRCDDAEQSTRCRRVFNS